jgi:photoactive yellow protein
MPDREDVLTDLTLDEGIGIIALESYDDTALDELPFGVICLDEHGTIVQYNLAEARLARLDRSRVLGKDFFRQIAPCTAQGC